MCVGGSSNAFTSSENTNYYFDVRHEFLHPSLDRFAQFFLGPLFTPSATDREIQAVHNENSKNLLTDVWRSSQLLKHLADPAHPYHKFGTGNAATLREKPKEAGVDVREELLTFHRTWYSANRMKLVVLGREGLDELEAWVTELFSGIVNKQVAPPTFPASPFSLSPSSPLSHACVQVLPIKDLRSLTLLFPLPSTDSLYHVKPTYLIGHLIGHESKGSILSLLKALSYANGLSAGMYETSSAFSLFSIGIELTEEGLLHTSRIIEIVFAYIALLHAASTSQWREVYEEEKAIHAMNFAFKSKESPANYASQLAGDLHVYAPAEILSGPRLYFDFDEATLRSILALLSPANMIVQLISRQLAGECAETEPWYESRYGIKRWTDEEWKRIEAPAAFSALHLPQRNEFIATDFTVKHQAESNGAGANPEPVALPSQSSPRTAALLIPPTRLLSSAALEVWWKADRTFLKPKANVLVKLVSPLAHQSPSTTVLTSLYARLLEDALSEYSYDADIAGLSYSLTPTATGLSLVFGGYNHKLALLVREVVKRMRALEMLEDRFSVVKEQLQRSYANFPMEQPYQHAAWHQLMALETHTFHTNEKIAALTPVTSAHVRSFIDLFLAQATVTTFIHGNMTAEEAQKVSQLVVQELAFTPLPPSLHPEQRTVQLTRGVRYEHSSPVLNPAEVNSAVSLVYQVGEDSAQSTVLLDLFCQLCKDSAFNQLRTVEQLGYLVWTGSASHRGVLSFRVIIQSADREPRLLEQRVEAFLAHFRTELVAMGDEAFGRHRAAVIARKQEKDKTLSGESNRHWGEISNGRGRFGKREEEVEVLRGLDKAQVVEWMDTNVGVGKGERRKLTALMRGKGADVGKGAVSEDEVASAAAGDAAVVQEEAEKEEGGETVGVVKAVEEEEQKSADGKAKGAINDVVADCDVSTANAAGEDSTAAAAAASPVDVTPVVVISDFTAFKRGMPLFPCLI